MCIRSTRWPSLTRLSQLPEFLCISTSKRIRMIRNKIRSLCEMSYNRLLSPAWETGTLGIVPMQPNWHWNNTDEQNRQRAHSSPEFENELETNALSYSKWEFRLRSARYFVLCTMLMDGFRRRTYRVELLLVCYIDSTTFWLLPNTWLWFHSHSLSHSHSNGFTWHEKRRYYFVLHWIIGSITPWIRRKLTPCLGQTT